MAKLPVEYHPLARVEANEAFDWYLDRSRHAAEGFQLELEKAQAAIQESPEAWAQHLAGTRRFLLKRYPYLAVYRLLEHRIEVVAVLMLVENQITGSIG
jgi:plasmid stabilization system protein ParE